MSPDERAAPPGRPVVRELTADECQTVLARNNVGRLAFTFHDRVDIEPINYVIVDHDMVFRTVPGSKVDVLEHHPWVAFEVDEVEGLLQWRSVVVHGTIYHPTETGTAAERAAYDKAVAKLWALVPPGSNEHPLASRPVVLRLHVNHITGREARTE
jgi:nitroimidazol reductase NimA-like FMN-containing flavoprotein (pyridoxamine 5'-phosphate oxidase superfamily)